jgi:hypothetical protein
MEVGGKRQRAALLASLKLLLVSLSGQIKSSRSSIHIQETQNDSKHNSPLHNHIFAISGDGQTALKPFRHLSH